jgi:two-component system LytT family response regulator
MNALIVDDERLARNELRRLLEPFSTITVVGEAANADEAEEQVSKLKPDLLFLDINMPGRDGMELLEALEPAPHVIFVTAYDEHAVKAFELNALDYLLKPIDPDRLAAAINKLAAIPKEGDQTRERLGPEDRIFLKDGEKCWFVALKDVRLLESEGNYVRVRFRRPKPLVLRSLNSLEEEARSARVLPRQPQANGEPGLRGPDRTVVQRGLERYFEFGRNRGGEPQADLAV